MLKINNSIPWVEKYRPKTMDSIVLDEYNKKILNNLLKNSSFPNTLFFGPPGTGKTTTIINLIKKYQENTAGKSCSELIIHLNASDERGIDTIRTQIQEFIKSETLFTKGNKFVILDEVDYMTKNGQMALKTLVEKYNKNVSFCLICNYISKIDKPLQDLFMHFRFTKLPKNYIKEFLLDIMKQEQLVITDNIIEHIIDYFKSDIRSMINYIQINQYNLQNNELVNDEKLEHLYQKIKYSSLIEFNEKKNIIIQECNIHERNLLKKLCYFIFFNHSRDHGAPNLIGILKFLLHNNTMNTQYLFSYLWSKLNTSCSNSCDKP